MTPDPTSELPSAPKPGRARATRHGITGENLVCAIIEALNSPDRFRLVECGGELFIEAVHKD